MDSKTSECNKDAHAETTVVLSNDNQLRSNEAFLHGDSRPITASF